VSENVLFRPAGQIEQGTMRKEIEARLGQFNPLFPDQAFVELFFQRMQVADVARDIFALGIAKLRCTPVAGLLLLGNLVAKKLAEKVL
jgi:hypothetical protein